MCTYVLLRGQPTPPRRGRQCVRTHSFTRTTSINQRIFNFIRYILEGPIGAILRISVDPISQRQAQPQTTSVSTVCKLGRCAHDCRHSISFLVLLITHPTRIELPAHAAPRRSLPHRPFPTPSAAKRQAPTGLYPFLSGGAVDHLHRARRRRRARDGHRGPLRLRVGAHLPAAHG